MVKTITEICIEIDNCIELDELESIRLYMKSNQKKYSLVDLHFIGEHIEAAVKEMARQDVAILFKNGFTMRFL